MIITQILLRGGEVEGAYVVGAVLLFGSGTLLVGRRWERLSAFGMPWLRLISRYLMDVSGRRGRIIARERAQSSVAERGKME